MAYGWSLSGPTTGYVKGSTTDVARASDFPAAVGGVRTLPAYTTWIVLDDVDLAGDRLVCAGPVTLIGHGAETCKLRSTGLTPGLGVVSSNYTLQLRTLGLYSDSGCFCVDVDGTGQPSLPALDWLYVNFNEGAVSPGAAARVREVANLINNTVGAFGDGYYIYDNIDSLVFTDSYLGAFAAGTHGVKIDSGASVNRRVRLTDCVVIASDVASKGVDAPTAAFAVTSESFISSFTNYSGAGSVLDGITHTDDQARIKESRGVTNSTRVGAMWMNANATPTAVASKSTFYKAAGVTVENTATQRFTHTANRLTYASELVETFTVQVTASLESNNNNVVWMTVLKNGLPITGYYAEGTTNGTNGRYEGLAYQEVVTLSQGDYLEIFLANDTGANDITMVSVACQVREV